MGRGGVSRPFEAVLFDMDGVLVDSEPMHVEAMREVLRPLGVPYTDEDNTRYFGFTDPEVFRDLNARHGLALDERALTRRRIEVIVRLTRERDLAMDGARDVPPRIAAAGYRLALASSSAPEIIEATLDALGIRSAFDVVLSGLTVGRGKPAPDLFLETASRLRVPPAGCLVAEDSRNGLLAAKAAGMACVAIPCAATRGQDFTEADWCVTSLCDLPALLNLDSGPDDRDRRRMSRP
jgi:HAD superfamily hydrolase (TIGR01509 family)